MLHSTKIANKIPIFDIKEGFLNISSANSQLIKNITFKHSNNTKVQTYTFIPITSISSTCSKFPFH